NPNHAFRTQDYLADNLDVQAAVNAHQMSAYEHFLLFGGREDRSPSHDFSRTVYLDENPDVDIAVQLGLIGAVDHFEHFGFREGRRFSATMITLTPGAETTVTGTSANHDDKKFFVFTAPASGRLTVTVETTNGVFAQAEVEGPNQVDVLETQPNNGINTATGDIVAGQTYVLRMRAPQDVPAAFVVHLRLN